MNNIISLVILDEDKYMKKTKNIGDITFLVDVSLLHKAEGSLMISRWHLAKETCYEPFTQGGVDVFSL